ncbi:MAG: DUF4105 domain-containing protein [Flammeovirgaceae bacterium]
MDIKTKRIFLIVLLFAMSLSLKANDEIQFSIITIGPYEPELYSAFGHSGIRYLDKKNNIDHFYNYGIFDFNQPNFYINFLNGKLLYMVAKYDYRTAEKYYIKQDRYIKEQVLQLNESEKILLYNILEQNIRPENRTYLYNYVYDNCATKIRDVLSNVYGESLSFTSEPENKSFRQLMDLYLEKNKWGDLGIDICLGPEIDDYVSFNDEMFLPEYLFKGIENAIKEGNKNIVSKTNIVNLQKENFQSYSLSPYYVFLIFFIISIYLSFRQVKYGIKYFIFDSIHLFISGIIGCLLVYLWFFTDHLSSYNFNIVWAMPLNIIISILVLVNHNSSLVKWYMFLYGVLLFSLLILWNWIPQNLNEILLFFILGIILRLFVNFISLSKNRL